MYVKPAPQYSVMDIASSRLRHPVWDDFVRPHYGGRNKNCELNGYRTAEVGGLGWRWKMNAANTSATESLLPCSSNAKTMTFQEGLDRGRQLAAALSSSKRNQIDDILQTMHEEPSRIEVSHCRVAEILWSPDNSQTHRVNVMPETQQLHKQYVSPQRPEESFDKRNPQRRFLPPLIFDLIGTLTDELIQESFGPVCLWRERSESRSFINDTVQANCCPNVTKESLHKSACKGAEGSLVEGQHQVDDLDKMKENQKPLPERMNREIDILWNPESQRCLGMELVCSLNSEPIAKLGVVCLPCKEPDSQSVDPRKRKVHFGPHSVHEYTPDPDFEKFDLWWKRGDFKTFMSENLHTACKTRQQPIVAEGFNRALQQAVTISNLFGDRCQLNEFLEKMDDEHRGLQLWCQYGHARRGLERFTSRQYYAMRKKQIKEHFKNVIALPEQKADPDIIRQVSERFSSNFAVLARMFGVADATAAKSKSQGESEWETSMAETDPTKTKIPKRFSI